MENTVPPPDNTSIKLLALFALALMLTGILFGCNTPHRLENRLNKEKQICDRHSDTAWSMLPVKTCLSWFPSKPPRTVTRIVKGKPDTITVQGETITVNCDSIVTNEMDKFAASHVPVHTTTRIVTQHDTVDNTTIVHDVQAEALLTLRIAALQTDNGNMAAKITQVTSQSGSRLKWAIGEGIALLAVLFLFGLGVAGKLSKIV